PRSAAEADYEPTVSPDGSQIAFVSYRNFKTADADLWLSNANGGNQRRLTDDVTSESTPAWSPDGTRIAFASDRNRGRNDLYVMSTRSGRVRRITTTHTEETEPTWSPDSKRIAFTRYPSPNNTASRILVVAADGSGLRMLGSKPYEQSPAWSP